MIISLMRHGSVVGPAALNGFSDPHCSEQGSADMLKQYNSLPIPSQIYSSPLSRCRDFAHSISTDSAIPLTILEDLKEISFGDWDGVPFDNMGDTWPDVEAYLENPRDITPPNGESIQDFYARVSEVWQQIVRQQLKSSEKHKTPLIVCHGAVIRMIIANVLQMDFTAAEWFSNLNIRHASITQVQVNSYNDKSWLRLLQVGTLI